MAAGAIGTIVFPNGKLFVMNRAAVLVEFQSEFVAIGSGAAVALGAMAYGATAREAVRIAIEFDVYSGGEIQEVRLDDLR
jgi:ATP-dependent protease HslVU (ClpYQ) peptidase subunit